MCIDVRTGTWEVRAWVRSRMRHVDQDLCWSCLADIFDAAAVKARENFEAAHAIEDAGEEAGEE